MKEEIEGAGSTHFIERKKKKEHKDIHDNGLQIYK